jgi:hypothetical protein
MTKKELLFSPMEVTGGKLSYISWYLLHEYHIPDFSIDDDTFLDATNVKDLGDISLRIYQFASSGYESSVDYLATLFSNTEPKLVRSIHIQGFPLLHNARW